jgi:hypothetical protein
MTIAKGFRGKGELGTLVFCLGILVMGMGNLQICYTSSGSIVLWEGTLRMVNIEFLRGRFIILMAVFTLSAAGLGHGVANLLPIPISMAIVLLAQQALRLFT